MNVLYWVCVVLFPFLFLYIFTKSITGQYARMNISDISLLSEYGFPNDASDPHELSRSLSRKAYIYYTLFIVNAVLLWLLPFVGRIVFYLSNAFLVFLCFGQYLGLSATKRAYRSLSRKTIQSWYTPIVRIYRTLLVYPVLLLIIFFTFFNLVFLK